MTKVKSEKQDRRSRSELRLEKEERRKAQVAETPELLLDFPMESEVINSPSYTFRIKALPDTTLAEISFDGKAWEPCREALGIWWYDQQELKPGSYAVRARVKNEEGEVEMSPWRHFSVVIPNQE